MTYVASMKSYDPDDEWGGEFETREQLVAWLANNYSRFHSNHVIMPDGRVLVNDEIVAEFMWG